MATPEEQIDEIVYAVLHDAAQEIVDDIQSRLSVKWPPSSVPGESPHRRTGNLRGNIDYLITKEGSTIVLTLASGAYYSAYLEPTRPFMAPTVEVWTPIIIQRLQDAFGGNSPVISPAGAISPTTLIAA